MQNAPVKSRYGHGPIDALRLYAATKGLGKAMEVVINMRRRYRCDFSEPQAQAMAQEIYRYGEKRYNSGYDVGKEKGG